MSQQVRRLDVRRLTGRAVVRDRGEPHRTSTTLELFFDLTFVVAVGRAAGALHHELAAGHVATGVAGFATMSFAVWWAWMNFTWYASAHDADDVPYRLLVFVQIAGALTLSTGVTRAVEDRWFVVIVVGYAIMRVGLVISWLRVARDQPDHRRRALRYTAGIAGLQVLWIAMLALPKDAQLVAFVVLALCELAVPAFAERAVEQPPFHAEHIEERYGLFTIILLGESILSAATGFQEALDDGGLTGDLLAVGVGGLVLAFTAWWLYFDHPGHLAPRTDTAFAWGYGHVIVFAALAAMGAGIHVAAGATGHHPHGDPRTAALAVAIPVAGFLCGLVTLMVLNRVSMSDVKIWPKLVGAVVIVIVGLVASVPLTVVAAAAVTAVLATWMVLDTSAPSGGQARARRERAT